MTAGSGAIRPAPEIRIEQDQLALRPYRVWEVTSAGREVGRTGWELGPGASGESEGRAAGDERIVPAWGIAAPDAKYARSRPRRAHVRREDRRAVECDPFQRRFVPVGPPSLVFRERR